MKTISLLLSYTNQLPFAEQLLCSSCVHPVEVETRIYCTKCSFFRAIYTSAHVHKRERVNSRPCRHMVLS